MKIQGNIDAIFGRENLYSIKNTSISANKISTADIDGLPEDIYEKSDEIEAEYPTYNALGTINQTGSARALSSNQSIQTSLKTLGFYYGPYDGSLTSAASKKAIRNFQTVYGLDCTGTMNQTTLSKLELVDGFRNRAAGILTENAQNELVKGLDYYEKENFASIWAFLRLGMKIDATHASAVMANIKAESGFSSDNLRDTETNKNHHDTDYVYKTDDGKAYGLLQWAFAARKQGLLNQAKSMGLQPKDLNAQLAYFRSETNNPSICKSQWAEFKNKKTLTDATEYFLEHIEMPGEEDAHKEDRIRFANEIYQLMYKL